MKFEKPPRENAFLIDQLLKRNLKIANLEKAMQVLHHIGYYRLTGYMYPFQLPDGSHHFKEGIDFEMVLEHYLFDRELRLLLLDVCERLEISIKSNIYHVFAMKYGSHWYLNDALFENPLHYNSLIEEITKYCTDCHDQFIKSYQAKYTAPLLPSVWMIFQTLTFGQISRLYDNLKTCDEKTQVATNYGSPVPHFESWLKCLNFIRNCSAHHARLWNRVIPIKPSFPMRKRYRVLENVDDETNRRLYGALSIIIFTMKKVDPSFDCSSHIKTLFKKYPRINLYHMGFPKDWENENVWKSPV